MTTLDRFAKKLRGKRTSETVGEGTVHTFGDGRRSRICVAVRGTLAMAVFSDGRRGADLAKSTCYKAAASGSPATSLAKDARFAKTAAMVARGDSVYGFVALGSLVSRARRFGLGLLEPPGDNEDPRATREALDAAKVKEAYGNLAGVAFGVDLQPWRRPGRRQGGLRHAACRWPGQRAAGKDRRHDVRRGGPDARRGSAELRPQRGRRLVFADAHGQIRCPS